MNKIIRLLLITCTLFILTSCADKEKTVDELIDYYNTEWIPIHVMKKNEVDRSLNELIHMETEPGEDVDEEIIDLLSESALPVGEKVIDRFNSLELSHREVKKVNELQIEAEKFSIDLLEKLIGYNEGAISEGEFLSEVNELKRKYDEVNDYLEKLMDKYNLEYDYDEGSLGGFYEIKRSED